MSHSEKEKEKRSLKTPLEARFIKTKIKPGFHIVVSVVSVVRKKFIGQIEVVSVAFVREVSLKLYLSYKFFSYDRYNDMETRLKIVSACLASVYTD